ncbi:MAG TPA: hypothetical protein VK874_05840 [Gaiellaceae bacterium]|nr:hypothetical protein [Gaiellaceae bacterium]
MDRLVASMSTLAGPVPEMDEAGAVAGEAMLPWLRDLEGFRGVLVLTDETRERARVLTFWESGEAAERSRTSREGMRDRMAATVGMEVESTETYVVAHLELTD